MAGDTVKQKVKVDKEGGKNQDIPIPIPDNQGMGDTSGDYQNAIHCIVVP